MPPEKPEPMSDLNARHDECPQCIASVALREEGAS